jgi:hypothetical protein
MSIVVKRGLRAALLSSLSVVLAAAGLNIMATAAQAAEPHYGSVVISDERDSITPKETFAPDTPKIFVTAQLVDMANGAKVKAAWIAEKTEVAPPNYEIDATDLDVGPGLNQANFALSSPDKGWPVGSYRVDLSMNGAVVKQLRFKVE